MVGETYLKEEPNTMQRTVQISAPRSPWENCAFISQPSLALEPCVHCWQATIQAFHRRPSAANLFQPIPRQSSTLLLPLPSLSPGEMKATSIRGRDHCLSLQLPLPNAGTGPGCPLLDPWLLAWGHVVTAAGMSAYFLFSVLQGHVVTPGPSYFDIGHLQICLLGSQGLPPCSGAQ